MRPMNLQQSDVQAQVADFIAKAKEWPYGLVADESYRDFILQHAQEIYDSYYCTGILVRLKQSGIAYHATPLGNIPSILEHGIRPSTNENATYGDGVIYTYPSLKCYKELNPEHFGVFEVEYGPGCLQAVITYDKDDEEQGELLVFPEKVKSIKQIHLK